MLLWAALVLLPTMAKAEAWTADRFPVPYLSDARRHVSDPDNILSPAVRDSIDVMLYELEQTRGVQSIVAVAKEIDGGDAYEFGMALARKYGVGQKKQNSGLILVLSTDDRAYYLLTGTGLEGALPDATCRKIENSYMLSHLKEGDWDKAMLNGTKAICAYVQKDEALLPEAPGDDEEEAKRIAAFAVAVFVALIAICVAAGYRRRKRCPKCGHYSMERTSQSVRRTADGRQLVIYKCSRCGYTEAREENNDGSGTGAAASAWPFFFLGSGGGGSFGGGGSSFGGGSFGGGSFGGGGAGGRF